MRFYCNKKPSRLQKRIINKFLILPVKIERETRWLETASIIQIYFFQGWTNIKWVNS
jgi:hypothetical protein